VGWPLFVLPIDDVPVNQKVISFAWQVIEPDNLLIPFLAARLVCWISVHDDTLLQRVQATRLSYQLTKVVGTLASLQCGA